MFSNPKDIIQQLPIVHGMTVVDIGSGVGYYTLPLSVAVGDKGKVYAVDIQKELLHSLVKEAKYFDRQNIEVILEDLERGEIDLEDNSCDGVILSNILFQIENREKLSKEIRRILKNKGFVAVIEWGDKNNINRHSIVTQEEVKKLFMKEHVDLLKNIDCGSHHYGMIFRKNEESF